MKHILYILLAFLALPVHAQRTAQTVQQEVDAEFVVQEAYIISQQTTIMLARGMFWQGLSTHSVVPPHTTDKNNRRMPDDSLNAPTDQGRPWTTDMPEIVRSGDMLATLVVNAWEGPRGFGFYIAIGFTFDDVKWRRRVAYIWEERDNSIDPNPAETEAWIVVVDI